MAMLSINEPKAVFFDAAGTLFDSVRHVAETYVELAGRHDKKVSRDEIASAFRDCFAAAPPLAFNETVVKRLEAMERLWWENLVRRIFEPTGTFERFDAYFTELFDHFAKTESWVLFDDTIETLEYLKDRRFILVLISNFDSRVLRIVEGLGIAPYFDTMVISSQAGYAKPAPEIFRLALEEHRIGAHEAIHVGDSPETDVEGALRAGVQPVLLDRNQRGHAEGAIRITGLRELIALL